MARFLKWVWNSWLGEWHSVGCFHSNKYGEQCVRIDCHPGACSTNRGTKFYPEEEL